MNLLEIFKYLTKLEKSRDDAVRLKNTLRERVDNVIDDRNTIKRDFYGMRDERDELQTELDQAGESLAAMRERHEALLRQDPDVQHWKNIAEDWDVKLQGAMSELSHVEVERNQLQTQLQEAIDWKGIAEECRKQLEERPPRFSELAKLLREAVDERDEANTNLRAAQEEEKRRDGIRNEWIQKYRGAQVELRLIRTSSSLMEDERNSWRTLAIERLAALGEAQVEFDKVQLDLRQMERERDNWEGVAEKRRKEEPKPFQVSVARCARCQGVHYDLEFKQLENSLPPGLLWARCPTTHSPIMLEQRGD